MPQGGCFLEPRVGGLMPDRAAISRPMPAASTHRLCNTRASCLGLEVRAGRWPRLERTQRLRKDNTGYDLRNMFIGAEGTLASSPPP